MKDRKGIYLKRKIIGILSDEKNEDGCVSALKFFFFLICDRFLTVVFFFVDKHDQQFVGVQLSVIYTRGFIF